MLGNLTNIEASFEVRIQAKALLQKYVQLLAVSC